MAQRVVRPQALQDLEAAHLRHDEVEQHDVGPAVGDQPERLARRGHRHELAIAGLLEEGLQDLDVERLVVDHHDDRLGRRLAVPLGLLGAGLGHKARHPVGERRRARGQPELRGGAFECDRVHGRVPIVPSSVLSLASFVHGSGQVPGCGVQIVAFRVRKLG